MVYAIRSEISKRDGKTSILLLAIGSALSPSCLIPFVVVTGARRILRCSCTLIRFDSVDVGFETGLMINGGGLDRNSCCGF
ncbi:hypothetical protein MtrunA17_Chr2g0303201 [Medicago truncatula]|uniref:Transmembrane protein n=1 Tax=Medicago truncatula TaxID=3880 RepID=A0A396J6P2_MEDTR|nr:hypothetical protein MtrunA17_Chr2g0303201 [Medicago truncatula]